MTAAQLIRMLANGGRIVSSNDLPSGAIDVARACGRMHVDEDGFGYIYLPKGADAIEGNEQLGRMMKVNFYPHDDPEFGGVEQHEMIVMIASPRGGIRNGRVAWRYVD